MGFRRGVWCFGVSGFWFRCLGVGGSGVRGPRSVRTRSQEGRGVPEGGSQGSSRQDRTPHFRPLFTPIMTKTCSDLTCSGKCRYQRVGGGWGRTVGPRSVVGNLEGPRRVEAQTWKKWGAQRVGFCVVGCGCWFRPSGPPCTGPPAPDRLKCRVVSLANHFALSLSLWVSSRGIWWC